MKNWQIVLITVLIGLIAGTAGADTVFPISLDAQATSTDGVNFTVSDGASHIHISRHTALEYRGILEFDIGSIPVGSSVTAASVTFFISLLETAWGGGATYAPEIQFYGYEGDGLLSVADAIETGVLLGSSGPIESPGWWTVDIAPDYVESILGADSYLGLLAYPNGDENLDCNIGSSEGVFDPAELNLTYTAPDPNTYWQGGSGNWSTGAKWNNGEPSTGDYAYINNGGTAKVTHAGEVCSSLRLGESFAESGTVELSGSGQLAALVEHIGVNGTGSFTQTGGTNTISSDLLLGIVSGSDGTYTITDGMLDVRDGVINVGPNGTGLFELNGGVVIADEFVLGTGGTFTSSASSGTLRVNTLTGFGPNPSFAGNLVLAHSGGAGSASYSLGTGQSLNIANVLTIGYDASATFTHNGGTNTVGGLNVVSSSGSNGTYELSGDGQLSVSGYGGINGTSGGTGTFIQTGSSNASVSWFTIGSNSGSNGIYALSEDGQLSAQSEMIAYMGTGTFTQTGGTNTILFSLTLAGWSGSNGTYELSGTGQLSASSEYVGYKGTGSFTQTGGIHTVNGGLYLGYDDTGDGTYNLSGGQLSTNHENIGNAGTGTFMQTGGTNTTEYLYLSGWSGYEGTYELDGTGVLSVTSALNIGVRGTGIFTQLAGSNNAAVLFLGSARYPQQGVVGDGTYNIRGGSLTVGDFYVGYINYAVNAGKLNIEDASADIVVSNLLHFGVDSVFTAVPGSTIHMTGSAFENENIDPTNLAGLSNLELIFEGGSEDIDPFELAGEDMGAIMAGFTDNFALGTLTLGDVDIGKIQLIDNFDNQPGWTGSEALYVSNLNIGAGSYLDLNGFNLYYLNGGDPKQFFYGDFDLDGDIDGVDFGLWQTGYPTASGAALADGDADGDGDVDGTDFGLWQENYPTNLGGSATIPEPATLALILIGGLALLRRRQ